MRGGDRTMEVGELIMKVEKLAKKRGVVIYFTFNAVISLSGFFLADFGST